MSKFEIIKKLCSKNKGILETDDNPNKMSLAFENTQIERNNSRLLRKEWRTLLFSTPSLEKYISGVTVHTETLLETTYDINQQQDVNITEILKNKGILIGIKIDQGMYELDGNYFTKGVDSVQQTINAALQKGASYTKWSSKFKVGASKSAINFNVNAASIFTAISQKSGLVPLIECSFDCNNGNGGITQNGKDCQYIVNKLFKTLRKYNVSLDTLMLKINFISFNRDWLNNGIMNNGKKFTYFKGFDKESYDVCNTTLDLISWCVPQSTQTIYLGWKGVDPMDSYPNLLRKVHGLQSEREISKVNPVYQNLGYVVKPINLKHLLIEWKGKFENSQNTHKKFIEYLESIKND